MSNAPARYRWRKPTRETPSAYTHILVRYRGLTFDAEWAPILGAFFDLKTSRCIGSLDSVDSWRYL